MREFISLLLVFGSVLPVSAGTTYLVIGSYRQADATGKPYVSLQTNPDVQVIPMESTEQCEVAGERIATEIFKPIWMFDGRWTCVEGK